MKHQIRRGTTALALTLAPALLLAQAGSAQAATSVASWHMEDSGSTMKDSSGNKLTGTLFGSVETGVSGYKGNGFRFSAPESYVLVSDTNVLDPGSSTWKISMRVRMDAPPSSTQGTADLLRKGEATTTGGDYKVEIMSTGVLHCLFRGSSGRVDVYASPYLADGQWHTVTCSRTASSVKATVDGTSATKSGRTGTISNSSAVYVGAKMPGGDDQFIGDLDEVRITKG